MSKRPKAFPLSLGQVVVDSKSASAPSRVAGKENSVGRLIKSIIKTGVQTTAVRPSTGGYKVKAGATENLVKVSGLGLDSARTRQALVSRLQAGGINDKKVLAAIAEVPRHFFVDAGLASQAYEDTALPIGYEQTISKPSIVARMIALLRHDNLPHASLGKVLEIGTGCGYQAAVLSRLACEVYSIERIKPLFEKAKNNLRRLRIANLRLHYGDGMLGLPEQAPFDAIILAAAGLAVPQTLYKQLAIGGKLIAPVATDAGQVLKITVRQSDSLFYETELEAVLFVPLKSGVI